MASAKNSKKNTGAAKGVVGGYLFMAPAGTAAPTDNSKALPEAFVNLGYVGEDGITFSPSYESSEHKDLNGDVVDKGQDGYSITFTAKLIEVKRDALAAKYGAANVTDEAGTITVHGKGTVGMRGPVVLELLLKGTRKMRRVVHDAEVTELGEEAVVSSDLFAQDVTFTSYRDEATGDFFTDYIASTETEAA